MADLGDLSVVRRELAALARAGVLRPRLPKAGYRDVLRGLRPETSSLSTPVGLHAVARGDDDAIVDERGTLSWRALDERVSRFANHLLGYDGPVALLLDNGREFVECQLGAARAGRPAVPLYTSYGPVEIAHTLAAQAPGLLVADVRLRAALGDLENLPPVLWVGDGGGYEDALAAASPQRPAPTARGTTVLLTSGTTGRPKGARRTSSLSEIRHLARLLDRVPFRAGDRLLVGPPLFHAFGQLMLSVAVVVGATLVLTGRFDARGTVEAARRHRVTGMGLVPIMLQRVLDLDDVTMPDLRVVLTSGSLLPVEVRRRTVERLGDVLYDLYGSTEAGWVAIATPADHRERPGTVGRPGLGMRVAILDDAGAELPVGQAGRITVATGGEFHGYTEGGDRRTPAGLLETGDVGRLDPDGFLWVLGRADDMIVSGGENVYPSEVEAALDRHPEVIESVVVGVADATFGQVLHAYVVPVAGAALDAEAVREWLRERVARYKVPKAITVVDELPRNITGKVLRRSLGEAPAPGSETL